MYLGILLWAVLILILGYAINPALSVFIMVAMFGATLLDKKHQKSNEKKKQDLQSVKNIHYILRMCYSNWKTLNSLGMDATIWEKDIKEYEQQLKDGGYPIEWDERPKELRTW